jgi:hypothetical protein
MSSGKSYVLVLTRLRLGQPSFLGLRPYWVGRGSSTESLVR